MSLSKQWLLDLAKLELCEEDAESRCERKVNEHQTRIGNSELLMFQEVDMSQNKIALRGCKAIVDTCLRCQDLRVVKLFKNLITDAASVSICRLLEECPGMEQLHLSNNLLTETGASEIIAAAHRGRVGRQAPDGEVLDRRDRGITLWLRLEHNRIRRGPEVLEELWGRCIDFCEARDANRCGPRICKRRALVHLPYFSMQDVDSLDGAAPGQPVEQHCDAQPSEVPQSPLRETQAIAPSIAAKSTQLAHEVTQSPESSPAIDTKEAKAVVTENGGGACNKTNRDQSKTELPREQEAGNKKENGVKKQKKDKSKDKHKHKSSDIEQDTSLKEGVAPKTKKKKRIAASEDSGAADRQVAKKRAKQHKSASDEEPSATTMANTQAPQANSLAGLGNLVELQKQIQEDHNKLKLFVIKAKQDWEDRREKHKSPGKEAKGETNDQEYYVGSAGEAFGPVASKDYVCEASIGKGVFSSVYQCKNIKEGFQCAVKIVRSHAMMRKAAEKEIEMCRRIMKQGRKADSEGVKFVIKLIGHETFDHQGHMCIVLELLKCDLRTALQKYGQGRGFPLQTVQQYSRQIFLALRMLRKLKVIHGDLKPDNILMSLNKLEVKLCDFGSAMNLAEKVNTSYAQPRYYRAPEIMVGLTYDTQIDLWSAGVTLYELAIGKILFTGKSNNAMLRQMMQVCGPFSDRMVISGSFSAKHFNKDKAFLNKVPDSITGEPEVLSMRRFIKPSKSFYAMMAGALSDPPPNADQVTQERLLPKLADLVGKCLRLDPVERFMPEQAVTHVFYRKDK